MQESGEYDLGLRTNIDTTSSPDYTYICKALNPNSTSTDKVWVCWRITNASGTKSFANGVSNFDDYRKLITVAEALTATYAS